MSRPPFDVARAAMLLLAALVLAGVAICLLVVTRCAFWFIEACNREFGFRDWLTEIIVVLVALLARSPPPPPPDQ